jgi:hypothetical protein
LLESAIAHFVSIFAEPFSVVVNSSAYGMKIQFIQYARVYPNFVYPLIFLNILKFPA